MMAFREMKTVHLLLKPTEDGWLVMHKKFKTFYGTITGTQAGDAARLAADFGENEAARAEALEAAVREIFANTGVSCIFCGNAEITRAAWQVEEDKRNAALHRTAADYADVLGRPVHCVMDRPLGSRHPRYPEMLYTVNYGCVPGVMAGDGAEQDVYILGPTVPLQTFDGVVIAVIHRLDDCEDKWVVAESGARYTADEIRAAVAFQEKYYQSELILNGQSMGEIHGGTQR